MVSGSAGTPADSPAVAHGGARGEYKAWASGGARYPAEECTGRAGQVHQIARIRHGLMVSDRAPAAEQPGRAKVDRYLAKIDVFGIEPAQCAGRGAGSQLQRGDRLGAQRVAAADDAGERGGRLDDQPVQ